MIGFIHVEFLSIAEDQPRFQRSPLPITVLSKHRAELLVWLKSQREKYSGQYVAA